MGNAAVGRLVNRAWTQEDEESAPIGRAGGRMPRELQRMIDRARAGGRPLDGRLTRQVGTALGAGLDGVRVHTDTVADGLTRSLSARAFTSSSDIFFRRGAYRPGSPSGDRLIAHELAHVVQQRGAGTGRTPTTVGAAGDRHEREADQVAARLAAGNPGIAAPELATDVGAGEIQRSVGYEFETNMKVERRRTGAAAVFKGQYRPMRKMEVITRFPEGFRMEADENTMLGSTIEFVVDPPVAENNGAGLERILQRLTAVAHSLSVAPANAPVMLNTLTNDQNHGDVRVTPQGPLTANPQVTGGVSFDKLLTLLSEIGGGSARAPAGHQEAAQELEAMAPQMPAQAAVRGAGVLGTAAFKGLVAVASSYIKFGAKQTANYPPLNYAKLLSNSVLMRTDLGSMFRKLRAEEREEYENAPDNFVDVVMAAAGQLMNASVDAPVIERGVRKGYTQGTAAYNQLVDSPATRLTRKQWLTGITRGVDYLSSYHMPALAHQLEGLGALGPTTDVVAGEAAPAAPLGPRDRGSGIVMEFRNMRKNVPWTKWHGLAADIFDYIVELNQR
jgi:hypothetical protein